MVGGTACYQHPPRDQLTGDELMRHIVRAAGPWEYYVRKVRIGLPHECWEWMGSVGGPGYGNWSDSQFGGKRVRTAHRAAYELFFGDPGALQVNHRCGNRRCCNPDHLYAGTQQQNHADSIKHGTHFPPPFVCGNKVGNQHGHSPLTEEMVRDIRKRRAAGERGIDLAVKLKVSPNLICSIYKRKTWAWVKD